MKLGDRVQHKQNRRYGEVIRSDRYGMLIQYDGVDMERIFVRRGKAELKFRVITPEPNTKVG